MQYESYSTFLRLLIQNNQQIAKRCARHLMWPQLSNYIFDLPDMPLDHSWNSSNKIQQRPLWRIKNTHKELLGSNLSFTKIFYAILLLRSHNHRNFLLPSGARGMLSMVICSATSTSVKFSVYLCIEKNLECIYFVRDQIYIYPDIPSPSWNKDFTLANKWFIFLTFN